MSVALEDEDGGGGPVGLKIVLEKEDKTFWRGVIVRGKVVVRCGVIQ